MWCPAEGRPGAQRTGPGGVKPRRAAHTCVRGAFGRMGGEEAGFSWCETGLPKRARVCRSRKGIYSK